MDRNLDDIVTEWTNEFSGWWAGLQRAGPARLARSLKISGPWPGHALRLAVAMGGFSHRRIPDSSAPHLPPVLFCAILAYKFEIVKSSNRQITKLPNRCIQTTSPHSQPTVSRGKNGCCASTLERRALPTYHLPPPALPLPSTTHNVGRDNTTGAASGRSRSSQKNTQGRRAGQGWQALSVLHVLCVVGQPDQDIVKDTLVVRLSRNGRRSSHGRNNSNDGSLFGRATG